MKPKKCVLANFGNHLVIIVCCMCELLPPNDELFLPNQHNLFNFLSTAFVDEWQVFVLWHTLSTRSSRSIFSSSLLNPHPFRAEPWKRVGLWKMHTGHKCYLDAHVESDFFFLCRSFSIRSVVSLYSLSLSLSLSALTLYFYCFPLFIFVHWRFIWVVERITSYAMDRKKKNARLSVWWTNAFRCSELNILPKKTKWLENMYFIFGVCKQKRVSIK